MHFYTNNFTLMTMAYGNELEEGKFGDQVASQTAGPFQNVPNMILTWPRGLTVKAPPPEWRQLAWTKGLKIPTDGRNLQFRIQKPRKPAGDMLLDPRGNLHLSEIFEILRPVIVAADEVLIIWSACRQVMLKELTNELRVPVLQPNRRLPRRGWWLTAVRAWSARETTGWTEPRTQCVRLPETLWGNGVRGCCGG